MTTQSSEGLYYELGAIVCIDNNKGVSLQALSKIKKEHRVIEDCVIFAL